jgi:hypothetical protein
VAKDWRLKGREAADQRANDPSRAHCARQLTDALSSEQNQPRKPYLDPAGLESRKIGPGASSSDKWHSPHYID